MSTILDRRQFLAVTTHAAAGAVLGAEGANAWAQSAASESRTKALTVIDAHAHFYDPTRAQGVPWPPPNDKLLYRSVRPKDYRSLPVPQPVTGTIVVEASPWLEDNQWVLDLAAAEPLIVGFVGNLPVGASGFAGRLRRFAANKCFRGIRLRDRKLDGLLDDSAVVADLKLLADLDLSLDLVGGMEILSFAARLAGMLPNLRIIIDHLAGVAVDGKAPAVDWLKGMRAVAGRAKIYCKLSGLVEGTGRSDASAPGDVEFYRPVLDAMREMFGPDRLIYASNWPVSERFAPLGTVQSIIEQYFRSWGRSAEEQVFSQAALAAYRWVQRTKSPP